MAVAVLLEYSWQYKGSGIYEIRLFFPISKNVESVTKESTHDKTHVSEHILVLDLQLHTLKNKKCGYLSICLDLHIY